MKVGDVHDGEVGILRVGPKLERRTVCKHSFKDFQATTFALTLADKSKDTVKSREELHTLPVQTMASTQSASRRFASPVAAAIRWRLSNVAATCRPDSYSPSRRRSVTYILKLVLMGTLSLLTVISYFVSITTSIVKATGALVLTTPTAVLGTAIPKMTREIIYATGIATAIFMA